ncbi:MAG: ABC transporter substrate-binding protein [Actinomycetota bacterium]|nr:ABC transporter substrate-binding protein [Actinomycetota bacterium]
MKRVFAGLTTAVVAALTLTACGGASDPLANQTSNANPGNPAPTGTIAIGSANFPESSLLAEIYASALEGKGVKVTKKLGIGSRETYYAGLQDGSIDLIPEYSGALLVHVNKDAKETKSDEVYTALKSALPDNLTVLAMSDAENNDGIAVTRQTAERLGLKTIEDLATKGGDVIFGGPPEFAKRVDGMPGLKENYGLEVKEYKTLDVGGPLTVDALKSGAITAADLFTTDPAIKANDFVILEDPKSNFAAQNVVPLINKAKVDETVTSVLDAVSAKLTTEILLELNAKLSAPDKPDAAKVAAEWLASAGI